MWACLLCIDRYDELIVWSCQSHRYTLLEGSVAWTKEQQRTSMGTCLHSFLTDFKPKVPNSDKTEFCYLNISDATNLCLASKVSAKARWCEEKKHTTWLGNLACIDIPAIYIRYLYTSEAAWKYLSCPLSEYNHNHHCILQVHQQQANYLKSQSTRTWSFQGLILDKMGVISTISFYLSRISACSNHLHYWPANTLWLKQCGPLRILQPTQSEDYIEFQHLPPSPHIHTHSM